MALQTDTIAVSTSLTVAGNTVADGSGNLNASNYLRVGTVTDPTGVGDMGAGLTGAGRWFYDQSGNVLNLYESSGGTLQTTLAFDTALTTSSQDIIGAINELDSAIAGSNELSEVLSNGNVTGGNSLLVTSGDSIDSATGVPLVIGPTTATGVTIGNTSGATAVLIDGGTGGFSVDALGDSNVTASNTVATTPVTLMISAVNTGATSGDSTIAMSATSVNGAGNISITADDLVSIDGTGFSIDGTGGASNVSNAGTLTIATSGGGALIIASDATLSLDSGGGTIETDATAFTADGALTITATSAVLSLDGTGIETNATTIVADAGLAISTTTTGVLSLDSGTTGDVDIGTNANAKTITIGNVTGATAVVYDAGSGGHSFTGDIGFNGVSAVGQSAAYTPTNVSADRAYDANATSINELADVVGTLIADLQATGLIG